MLQLRDVRQLNTAAEVIANMKVVRQRRKAMRAAPLPISRPPKLAALELPPAPPPPVAVFTHPPLPPDEPAPRKQVYAFEVRNMVAEHYGLTIEEMTGDCRRHIYAKPRHIAMYLMMHCTGMGGTRIGKLLGGRDHSTITYAVRTMERRILAEPEIAAEVAELEAKVEARRT